MSTILKEGIHYKKINHPVWKYELLIDIVYEDERLKGFNFNHEYFFLKDGVLTAKAGYAWDGASGPMPDWDSVMRASLFHDTLWQAIKLNLWPNDNRRLSNEIFEEICIEDGMRPWLAKVAFYAVEWIGPIWMKLFPK